MKALPSIRQRLSRAVVLLSLAWGIAVSLVVGLVVRHEANELMDDTLRESAQILQGLLAFHAGQLPMQAGAVLPAPPHKEDLVWQVVDARGQLLLRSHQAPAQALVGAGTRGFATVGRQWRVHAQALEPQADSATPGAAPTAASTATAPASAAAGLMLVVAQRTAERDEAEWAATAATAGSALAVGLLCALWLTARVRRELQPISELSAAVAGFDPLQDGARLPDARRQELEPMRQAVGELGTRLARRVANERAFTAHAAHALRTPLAGMVAQLAAAQRVAPEPVQPMLALARQAADRLRRVVAALLTLFRSGGDVQRQPLNLADLVSQLQVPGLSITAPASPTVQADPDLLSAALANLLDNAVRHGATRAEISLQGDQGSCCLRLADNGPGIPEPERLRLQAALAGQDYGRCSGLGLMLADLVARAHGGALRLPAVPAGCTVELVLAQPR